MAFNKNYVTIIKLFNSDYGDKDLYYINELLEYLNKNWLK